MSAASQTDIEPKVSVAVETVAKRPATLIRRPVVLAGGALFLTLALAGAFTVLPVGSRKSPETIPELPEIPVVNLEGADPVIAKIVRESREFVEESPQAANAWGRYAMVLQAHGFYEASHRCYDTAIKLDAWNPKWPYLQGFLYYEGRQGPEAALSYFKIAADHSSPDSLYRMRYAETLLELGRLDEAEKEYRTVLAIRQDPQAQLGMGKLALARRQYHESLPYLQSAAEQIGVQKTACALLVTVYDRLGDQASAEHTRKRLAEMPNDRVRANDPILQVSEVEFGLLGELRKTARLIDENRVHELVAVVEDLVRRYPDSFEAWEAMSNAYQRGGDLANTERAARRCVQLAPKNADAWLHLGKVLISQRRYQEALEAVQKSIELNPKQRLAYQALGACRKGLGDDAGAAEAFQLAGVEPSSPPESPPKIDEPDVPLTVQRNVAVLTFYYADPQPEKAKQVLVDLISPQNLDDPWYRDRGIVLQLMAANLGDIGFGQQELIRFYESKFEGAPNESKRLIIRALRTCGDKTTEQVVERWRAEAANAGVRMELAALQEHLANPYRKRIRDLAVQQLTDLDYLWGDFFATGDYAPISRILDVFDLPDDSANAQLKQAARISTIANIQQHPKLVEMLKKNLGTRPEGSKIVVAEMLKRLEGEAAKK